MAYGITHFFSGGTASQYEANLAAAHPSRDVLPDGQLFHAAGPVEGGWLICAVHDSKESWEKFRDNTLIPGMQAGIEGGLEGPPEETTFEVHHMAHS